MSKIKKLTKKFMKTFANAETGEQLRGQLEGCSKSDKYLKPEDRSYTKC